MYVLLYLGIYNYDPGMFKMRQSKVSKARVWKLIETYVLRGKYSVIKKLPIWYIRATCPNLLLG